MSATIDSATETVVLSAMSFLKQLHDDAAHPVEARRRLRQFQEDHSDVHLELVADEEAFEPSLHYDLLVRFREQESISLSYCHDHGLPWAMRGARRWTERDLLRVNQVVLRVDDVLGCMEFDWNDASSMRALVDIAILREALEREVTAVSPEEMQLAMDVFRRRRGLHRATDTQAWLRERGISHEQLDGIVFQQAMAANFRTRLVAHDVEPYYLEHRAEFDTAAVALMLYREEAEARNDSDRIRRGEIGFYAAAEQNVLRSSEACSPETTSSATVSRLRRRNLPPQLATELFSATAEEVIGPIRFGAGWTVARLLAITPATLDEPTRKIIEQILFDRWLEKQRATAEVEWYWGNTQQTGATENGVARA